MRRAINGLRDSPVLGRTKSFFSGDQSSLKLVERAEIHIWFTAELGEMTNLAGGSSKEMWMAPPASSTSKSADSSALISAWRSAVNDCSDCLLKSDPLI